MKKTIIITAIITVILTSCVWLVISYRNVLINHETRISAVEQFLTNAVKNAQNQEAQK